MTCCLLHEFYDIQRQKDGKDVARFQQRQARVQSPSVAPAVREGREVIDTAGAIIELAEHK